MWEAGMWHAWGVFDKNENNDKVNFIKIKFYKRL